MPFFYPCFWHGILQSVSFLDRSATYLKLKETFLRVPFGHQSFLQVFSLSYCLAIQL